MSKLHIFKWVIYCGRKGGPCKQRSIIQYFFAI